MVVWMGERITSHLCTVYMGGGGVIYLPSGGLWHVDIKLWRCQQRETNNPYSKSHFAHIIIHCIHIIDIFVVWMGTGGFE